MRSTPVGIVMLNDERDHVWKANNAENRKIVDAWAKLIGTRQSKSCPWRSKRGCGLIRT